MKRASSLLALTLALGSSVAPRAEADEITYTRDVAPILFEHCAECHTPGQIGPFPLLSYKDAAKRARQIKTLTARRQMPPWHAEPGHFVFKDERRLTDEEIATLAKWADSGAPEGDPKDLPPAPKAAGGWIHGVPDLVIELPEVEIAADGDDVFIDFVAEIPVEERRWLSCIELLPGNRSVVHHANIKIDRSGGLSKWRGTPHRLDGAMSAIQSKDPLDPFLGWVPGTMPHYLPDGFGVPIDPGANVLVQFHYHPTGKLEKDSTKVGIYFSENASKETFAILSGILSRGSPEAAKLNIPAGEKNHEVRFSKILPVDGRIHTIQAHGHFLLKDLDLIARLPDGESKLLLSIRDWDFNWQERYAFEDPPLLPGGTELEVIAIYDNSADNPQNPSDPPKPVRAGPQSTDEMCGVGLVVIPENPEFLDIPAGGVPYPQGAPRLQEFDKDGNGRFSKAEFDEIPVRVRVLITGFITGATPPSSSTPTASKPPADVKIPKEGLEIPAEMAQVKQRLDTNKDGRLTEEELAGAPEEIRQKILSFFVEGVDFTPQQPDPTKGESPDSGSPAKGEIYRIPSGGVVIPAEMTLMKDRLDKDGDGRLTEEELLTAPEAIQTRLREYLRDNSSDTPPPADQVTPPNAPPVSPPPSDPPITPGGEISFPKEGFEIPAEMTQLRERLDTDQNGRLSEEEFLKAPDAIRSNLLEFLKQKSP